MAAPASASDPPLRAALARAFAALVRDDAVARGEFEDLHARAEAAGDREVCALCAAGMVVGIAIEFADFRGLAEWTARLDALAGTDGGLALGLAAIDQLRLDSALITLPSLDGAYGFDARCEAAARRAAQAQDEPLPLSPDERMLHTKMLLDYYSLRHEVPRIEEVMAFGHEQVRRPGVSPAWQARWWVLVLLNREYFGQTEAAGQARARLAELVERHDLPAMRHELACIEMSSALKADDLALADQLFREIDARRPQVRPGRLPHGLRAQASYLARRGRFTAALERVQLLLALCADVEVPRRDQGAYQVLRAYCLAALERWSEALEVLAALRPDHQGAQGELLEVIIETVRVLQALQAGAADAAPRCARVLEHCAALSFNRFLLPLPAAAARLVEAGLDQGVVPEFLASTVHDRRLQPHDATRENWPWRLKIRVLGTLRLARDGIALASPGARAQRKPLELLCLLAAHGGGPLTQHAVIEQLWPSLDAEAPKASLEMAVSRLRKLLGHADLVRVAEGQVSLDMTRIWVDAGAFDALCQRGDDASLSRALALYEAPLLGTASLTGLAHTARTRLALLYAQAVGTLAQHTMQRGDAAAAAAIYRSALAHEPLAETLHRGLIEALARQGEQAEALAAYRRLRELLVRGLGVAPSPQTESLVQAVRSGAIGPGERPRAP